MPDIQTQQDRAWDWYYRLRAQVETPENIGRLVIVDAETGDYEIADDPGVSESFRLQARHPGATLVALRIGYQVTDTLGGILERLDS